MTIEIQINGVICDRIDFPDDTSPADILYDAFEGKANEMLHNRNVIRITIIPQKLVNFTTDDG